MRDSPKDNPAILLVDYLIACCLYYEFGVSEMSDFEFDTLARELRDRWYEIEHQHKHLVDHDSLRNNTSGYYIEYPTIVRSVAYKKARLIPGSIPYTRKLVFPDESFTAFVCATKKKTAHPVPIDP